MKNNVLVLCHDTLGSKMAGPGIRYQNLADQIKRVANVTLAVYGSPKKTTLQPDIQLISKINDDYKNIFDKHDVIFAQWLSGEMLDYAKNTGKVIIIDLYAPVPIEYLASLEFSLQKIGKEKDFEFSGILETYKKYLASADFFVCSNERQRDFWLGFITASNILRPTTFKQLSRMSNLALCPMGISSTPPLNNSLQLRDRVGLKKEDFVMLWTGGIWDWFDALTVIKAVNELNEPNIKLVFMGTQHPNSEVEEMSESKAARTLASDLKLTGKSVFFLDGWIDFDDRASYLLDANVAIYADKESVETRFSHRTRVLDHIWASLPTICSKGDYLSSVIEDKGMGIVADQRTPESFAKAIDSLYQNPKIVTEIKTNIKHEQVNFTWDTLSVELLHFIENCNSEKKLTAKISAPEADSRPVLSNKITLRRVKNSIKVLLGRIDV